MNPQIVAEAIDAAAVLVPALIQLGGQIRDQLSTDDQAKLDASLAKLQGQREAAVAQAQADLAAAATE